MGRPRPGDDRRARLLERQGPVAAPAPRGPAAIADRPVAAVTGGSRGIGAETCVELATRGLDVALTYRNKASRADDVAAACRHLGVRALPVQADMAEAAQVRAFAERLRAWAPRLDALVLSASGGLERDLVARDPGYPMRINRDAQLAFLDAMLPLLASPSTVVFVTSHWAHLYGAVAQLPDYEPIAAGKHAGETALRARQGELAARGVRLVFVTGDLVEGTVTAKLLERRALRHGAPGGLAQRPAVSPRDMAVRIADAVTDVSLRSGHTVVVGGALDELPRL